MKGRLRIIERHGAADTAKYFDASLATTDYYVRECGTWAGKGAERLGLAGQVRREDFMALATTRCQERMNGSRFGSKKIDEQVMISVSQAKQGQASAEFEKDAGN